MPKYICLLLILLCGCELVLNVDVPHDKESLVINAIFAADSVWQVGVSYDRGILDEAPFKIAEDAEVVIYDESGPVETLKLNGNKVYRGTTSRPVPGKRYQIHVSSPGHEPVSSEAYVPEATEIVAVKTHDTFIDDKTPSTAFDITIKDDPLAENYYRVFVASQSYNFSPGSYNPYIVYYRMSVESDDPLLADDNNLSERGVLMKDALFNGKEAKLSVKTRGRVRTDIQRMRVNVQTLSKAAYDYFITSQLQQNTSDDPLAQPVKVFNNVSGGFGIFAGYNQTIFSLGGAPAPVIKGISPMTGRPGDEITIEGSNFSDQSWGNQVTFRAGLPGKITESSSTHIKCIVPPFAVTGQISVFVGSEFATSKEDFVVSP